MTHPTRLTALVCGGRDYSDAATVITVLDNLRQEAANVSRRLHLVTGGATGADALAERWARARGVPCRVYHADWDHYGRSAGMIRNQQMLDSEPVDVVIAFPGGRGTADMIRRASLRVADVRKIRASRLTGEPPPE